MQLRIDFTAPALGALMCLLLPMSEVSLMCFAALLHESAHFLAFCCCGCKPQMLRISAVGMNLCGEHLAVYPLKKQTVMLLAGVTANFAAGMLCLQAGYASAAMWQFATAFCNLLPYRSTDGGTLLYLLLEHAAGAEYAHRVESIWRLWIVFVTVLFACWMLHQPQCSVSMWAMLLFFFAAEWLR